MKPMKLNNILARKTFRGGYSWFKEQKQTHRLVMGKLHCRRINNVHRVEDDIQWVHLRKFVRRR